MQDRAALLPNRYLVTPEDGSGTYYVTLTRADQPTADGTLLNKANLLSDTTATELGLTPSDELTVDDAFAEIASSLDGKADDTHASQHYADGTDKVTFRPSVITYSAESWVATDDFGVETDVSGGTVEITGATFKTAVSDTVGSYVFTYVSSEPSWQLDSTNVSLSTYGITLTETPSDADTITAEYAVKYVQSVSCPGITSSMKPKIDLYLDDTLTMTTRLAQITAFSNVSRIDSGTDIITLTCFETEPTDDFDISVEVAL